MKKVGNRTGKCSAFLRKKNQKKITGVTWVQEVFALQTLFQQPFLASSKERDAGWIFIPVVPVAQIQTKQGLLTKILVLFLCEGAGHRKEDHTFMRKTQSTSKLEVGIKEKVMDQSLSFCN